MNLFHMLSYDTHKNSFTKFTELMNQIIQCTTKLKHVYHSTEAQFVIFLSRMLAPCLTYDFLLDAFLYKLNFQKSFLAES